jgi:predicted RNA-binding Zn-ribbon protein involved in translation (DUF1610 family)
MWAGGLSVSSRLVSSRRGRLNLARRCQTGRALRGRAGTCSGTEVRECAAVQTGSRHAVSRAVASAAKSRHSRALGSGLGAHGWIFSLIESSIASRPGAVACAIAWAARGQSLAWTVTHIWHSWCWPRGIAATMVRTYPPRCVSMHARILLHSHSHYRPLPQCAAPVLRGNKCRARRASPFIDAASSNPLSQASSSSSRRCRWVHGPAQATPSPSSAGLPMAPPASVRRVG